MDPKNYRLLREKLPSAVSEKFPAFTLTKRPEFRAEIVWEAHPSPSLWVWLQLQIPDYQEHFTLNAIVNGAESIPRIGMTLDRPSPEKAREGAYFRLGNLLGGEDLW